MTTDLPSTARVSALLAGRDEPPFSWRDALARAPLLPPAVGLVVGVVIDSALGLPVWVYVGTAIAVGGLLLWPMLRRRRMVALVAVLAASCGALLHVNAHRRVPADHIVHHVDADHLGLARVRGVVVTPPRLASPATGPFAPWMYSPDRTSFLLDVRAIQRGGQFTAASGRIRVTVKEAVLDIGVGDPVELFGRLYRPLPPENPGEFDWAKWERRRGVLAAISCKQAECVTQIDSAEGGWFLRWITRLRQRARALVLDEMLATGDRAGSLLDAMVLARRSAIDPRINEAFIRIGCAHYLAASGFHVGLLAVFLYGLGRLLGARRRSAAVFVAVATVAYAVIAEPRPPILRATVLAVAVCASLIAGRRGNALNWLALAAIANVMWRPTDVFDAGFQMSYVCVAGLILMTEPIRWLLKCNIGTKPDLLTADLADDAATEVTGSRFWRRRAWSVILRPSTLFLAACLPSWPIILFTFQRFSPWAWLNTLIVTIPVAVVMCLGFAALLIGSVSPLLASLINPLTGWAAVALLWIVEILGRIPGVATYVSSPPPATWIVVYYATLVAWVAVYHRAVRRRTAVAGTVLLVLASVWWLAPAKRATGDLTVTVLSVGRGLATVIQLPDGSALLYDAGCSGSYDPGKTAILPCLNHYGIKDLGAAYISHPNLDHFVGLLTVADRLHVKEVLVSPYFQQLAGPDSPSRRLLEELRARQLRIREVHATGNATGFGGATIEILWPAAEPRFEPDSNDSSLVLRVGWQGYTVLLPGDIEERAQAELLDSGIDLKADVLVLPHHGGLVSNTAAFVAAVDPAIIIQSNSRATAESAERLGTILDGRRFLNTADDGAVCVKLGSGVQVSTVLAAGQSAGGGEESDDSYPPTSTGGAVGRYN